MSFHTPPPARAGARAPVRFSDELGREICARIARGESQHALSREPGMPSRRTFRDWALRDPAFARDLAAAKAKRRRLMLAKDDEVIAAQPWRRMLTRQGRRGGSLSNFTPELGEAICARIAAGESVLSVGADPAMPCAVTIYNWARREAAFREAYAKAKAICADMLFDLSREIALGATEVTVRSDRLRVQTLRWQVAQLAPKKYGPEALKGTGEADADGRPYYNIILQQYGDPGVGPQFTDEAGNEVPRPDWA
jgi:hypothetical protein